MEALRQLEQEWDISLSYEEPLDFEGLIDAMEPEFSDFVSPDYVNWYQEGELVLRIFPGEDWTTALRQTMDRDCSWPNAWYVAPGRQPIILDIWD